jgi:hypothetical protein
MARIVTGTAARIADDRLPVVHWSRSRKIQERDRQDASTKATMANMTRTEVAKDLARWHFIAEPEIKKIFWIGAPGPEGDPLRFLELASRRYGGEIEIFGFDGTREVPYPFEVALITEQELKLVAAGVLSLPEGWTLDDHVQTFTREALGVPVEAAGAEAG